MNFSGHFIYIKFHFDVNYFIPVCQNLSIHLLYFIWATDNPDVVDSVQEKEKEIYLIKSYHCLYITNLTEDKTLFIRISVTVGSEKHKSSRIKNPHEGRNLAQ